MKITDSRRWRARRIISALATFAVLLGTSGARPVPRMGAADTVVVIVSAASFVTQISQRHLADLYLGRTTRFENGSPAVPIDHRSGSTERAAFSEVYLDRSETQMKAHWSKIIFTGRGRPPREASSGEAVRELVASDPRAIGYLDPRLVNSTVRIIIVR
jgi:ABC-type phosphate transport system substrate-binding protein